MIKGRQKDLAHDLVTEINENIDNKPGPLQKKQIISWVLLAALPSSLLYGITDYLSTHVAAVPLFWVIPLILYLLTYILAFSKKHFYPGLLLQRLFGLGAIIVVITITLEITTPLLIVLPAHLITLFLAAFLCHGKLAKSRPVSEYLTEYYLLIAFGGFLGGIANAIIAPYIFKDVREYLIAIVLVLLFRDSAVKKEAKEKTKLWKEFLYIGAIVFSGIFFLWMMKVLPIKRFEYSRVIVFGAPMLICYSYVKRPLRYVSGIIVLAAMALVFMSSIDRAIDTKRNFFGVAKVFDDNNGQFRFLIHGVTIHGIQALAGENRHEPFAYYGRKGPLGEVFEVYNEKKDVPGNIAVLGLGIGSIAAYGKEGQKWVFYEINPDIIKIAEDPELFSMLKGSSIKDTYKIFLGDARIKLQEADNSYFGLIVIDVFSSDYIPVHLLTREAMHLYLDKLSNNGILAFHLSSRYLNLAPIIAALAKDEQLVAYLKEDLRIGEKHIPGTLSSRWIIVARAERDLGKLAGSRENWRKISPIAGISSWTDQYSNIVGLFK